MCLATNINEKLFCSFVTSVRQRDKCNKPRGIESRISAFRGSEPPLRLCGELCHEVVRNLNFFDFSPDLFIEFKTYHLSHSVHKSLGGRLEKLDQVEGLIKDVIENWNSFQEAFRDAYPFEGRTINRLFSTN